MQSYGTWYEKNVEILQKCISSSQDISFFEADMPDIMTICKARNDQLSVRYDDLLLHSLYDPEKEAKRFVEAQDIKNGDYILLYGMGLGYHVKYIQEKIGKTGQLVIFEPNVNIMNAALVLADFSQLVILERTHFIIGVDMPETSSRS